MFDVILGLSVASLFVTAAVALHISIGSRYVK